MNYVTCGLMTVFVCGNSRESHKHKNGTDFKETIWPYKKIKRRKERKDREWNQHMQQARTEPASL